MQARKRLFTQPVFWLSVCVLASLFVILYPVYVIRPFRFQGAAELGIALGIIRYRPAIVITLSIAALFAAVLCWIPQRRRTLQRVTASIGACLVIALAFLSRINVYELMFHPLDRPTFSGVAGTKLDGKE